MSVIARLTPEQKIELARAYQTFSKEERAVFAYSWPFWARPEQLPPEGDWRIWMMLTGRGWGKTRALNEWVRAQIESGLTRGALIARTSADVRDVMVEGESGLLSICPNWNRPLYEPSKRRIVWPNGAQIALYSAEEPDSLRGPAHSFIACDELAAWPNRDAWDQAQFGLRLGSNPRTVIATTPRPSDIILELVERPDVVVTSGSTFDNSANLAPGFIDTMRAQHGDTRMGRQELLGLILRDTPGALWNSEMIERARVKQAPDLMRICIGVDPAISNNESSDETGIIVAGKDGQGHFYVLEDGSMKGTPHEWASRVIMLYRKWRADRVIAEVNQGGDLVQSVLRSVDRNLSFEPVRATRGKYVRGEPVAALYEQGRGHHVGHFPELEEQLCSFTPSMPKSPDRADAMIWAAHELIVQEIELQLF